MNIFKITRSFGTVPFESFLKERIEQLAKDRYGMNIEVTKVFLDRDKIGDIHDPKTWEEKSI